MEVCLTALDTSGHYMAVGSSTGMRHLYCRRLGRMKYDLEGKIEAITTVKPLSCSDDLVAAGSASGRSGRLPAGVVAAREEQAAPEI